MTESRPVHLQDTDAAAVFVQRLAGLEPMAWQLLFDQEFPRMYRFAYARTGDPQLAEDIASEVFAAAAQGIARYRHTGAPIAAWLFRIARNITADHLEKRRKRPQSSIDDVEIESPAFSGQIDERTDLAYYIKRLSREQQEVIALRFFNDCSLNESAHALGKSVGAVKVLQHRALAALKKHMTQGKR
ncbi:MAG TPA: sigma-70 family RNA polymerase sigma factor [Dehalococcoidia bacterium]|nr:sigma-70 family RNA polymerase sigma factor [Dehalococcoidia bacterium]